MSLEVVLYPHPVLRHVSKPLKRVDKQVREWVAEMFDLMYEHEGIGLAANQVGLPYRMFVVNVEGDPDRPELERVYLNPVLSQGKGLEEMREGCLSLPDIRGPVSRNQTIRVQAYDLAGNAIDETLAGMDARVVLHETDHLDGILLIDKFSATTLAEVRDDVLDLEDDFDSRQRTGDVPTDEQIAARIAELESLRA
ncbi:MAG: peptide deformylase [Lacipirellulaceae bacterium]